MPGTFSPPPRVSGFLWSRWRGKTFPAFPAHAQPAVLRIWYEPHVLLLHTAIWRGRKLISQWQCSFHLKAAMRFGNLFATVRLQQQHRPLICLSGLSKWKYRCFNNTPLYFMYICIVIYIYIFIFLDFCVQITIIYVYCSISCFVLIPLRLLKLYIYLVTNLLYFLPCSDAQIIHAKWMFSPGESSSLNNCIKLFLYIIYHQDHSQGLNVQAYEAIHLVTLILTTASTLHVLYAAVL